MAEVTASLVKELREMTGAGMMDCKKALGETNGDLQAAVEWLRKKGLSAAAKKSGRVAADGLVGVAVKGGKGAIVEVNSETDFVARNDSFQAFVNNCASLSLQVGGDLAKLQAQPYPGSERTVADELTHMIATIGENMSLRRCAAIAVEPGVVVSYMHNSIAPGLGKIAVLVALKSTGDAAKVAEFGKQIAMHIAAANPQAVKTADLDKEAVDRERRILTEQAGQSGKPAEIVAKMVEGRLRKYYEEVVLLEQVFVVDGETKIAKVVEQAAKTIGAPVEIAGYIRFGLGEGISKSEQDFAAEVAKLAG